MPCSNGWKIRGKCLRPFLINKVRILKIVNTAGIVALLVAVVMSCQRQSLTGFEHEKDEILKMHQLQRDFHFNKDSIGFAKQLSENFISINRGVVTRPTKQETISRYHQYFSSVEFVRWDDVTDPVVRFSDDGKLAYTIVDKIVEVTYVDENGDPATGETHFAWTAIYKIYDDQWKIDCVTSTEKSP